MTKLGFLIFSLTIFLTACHTFSRKECEEMDWAKQGMNFALQGKSKTEGEMYFTRECRGIPMDPTAFRKGYDEGLKTFCTPGYIHGFAAKGGEFRHTCPEDQVTEKFRSQYHSGREKFLDQRVRELESDLAHAEGQISSLESEVSQLRGDLNACQSANQ
jgi:hypothetical protein